MTDTMEVLLLLAGWFLGWIATCFIYGRSGGKESSNVLFFLALWPMVLLLFLGALVVDYGISKRKP